MLLLLRGRIDRSIYWPMEIGKRVAEWRLKCEPRVSQAALAKAIGVTQPTVSDFESGGHYLSDEAAMAFERYSNGTFRAEECVHPSRRKTFERIAKHVNRRAAGGWV